MLKPVCLATETSWITETLQVTSLFIIICRDQITKALIKLGDTQAVLRLCGSHAKKPGFLAPRPTLVLLNRGSYSMDPDKPTFCTRKLRLFSYSLVKTYVLGA